MQTLRGDKPYPTNTLKLGTCTVAPHEGTLPEPAAGLLGPPGRPGTSCMVMSSIHGLFIRLLHTYVVEVP